MTGKYNINLLESLKDKVEIPLEEKLRLTDAVIETNLRKFRDDCVVSWSGGKDSTLVLWFVREIWPDIKVVFNDTGVEYPETIQFIKEVAASWKLNLTITKPIKTFWKCAEEYGFPNGSKSNNQENKTPHCCYFLKEKPMKDAIRLYKWKAVFDGVTAVESRIRMFSARDYGTCHFNTKWHIQKVRPILYWTEDEVFDFMKREGIPLNPRYSMGARRVGCMTCTAYKSWESRMSMENPKLYTIIKARKDGFEQGRFSMK